MDDQRRARDGGSWRGATAAAVAVAALVIGSSVVAEVNEWRSPSSGAPTAEDVRPVELEVYGGEYGISLGLTIHPKRARAYRPGTVRFDDEVVEDTGYFWSERWDEIYPPPDPFPVKARTKVLFEFSAPLDCGRPAADSIVITLDAVLEDGDDTSDTYVATNVDEYQRAYEKRCEEGVYVSIAGGTFHPNGDSEVTGVAINPGPGAAVVTIPAYVSGSTRWEAVEVTVPAGESRDFRVNGTGAPCHRDTPDSWSGGKVLVNGEPYVVADTGDHWCG